MLRNHASSPIGLCAISSISSIRLMRSIVFQRQVVQLAAITKRFVKPAPCRLDSGKGR